MSELVVLSFDDKLVKSADSEQVLKTLSGVGGKVLRTTVSEAERQRLEQALQCSA
jgi:uncharacterized membrane protein